MTKAIGIGLDFSTGRSYYKDHCISVGIVDDEPDMIYMLEKWMEKYHIPVCFTAQDGNEAIWRVKEAKVKPQVILMDYRLFSSNGIDTMKEVFLIDPSIRIIFLSADIDVQNDALMAGAWAFIKKPAKTKDIMAAVHNALN
jgi:CheY-like chemotaxis protein